MSSLEMLLRQAVSVGALRALDVQFARLLAADSHPLWQLVAALVSAEAGEGHVCLPLAHIVPENLLGGRHPTLAAALWQAAGAPASTEQLAAGLAAWPALGRGDSPTPLVWQRDRLYLQRLWQSEGRVASFFARAALQTAAAPPGVRARLDALFGDGALDWQKIAAAVALTRRVSVISGGPGTGKTTTVARLLAALLQTAEGPLRIYMAAPTGKAAARLTESLGKALAALPLSESERQRFPAEATTLHRLLGARPDSQRLRHHRDNPLHLDVLVVDEASMVDLPMMANLLAALPPQARILFLGDRDQLASVEAGAVLGDICRFAEQGYSAARAKELEALTGCTLPAGEAQGSPVRDTLCLLRHSYRFDAGSGIGQLAQAVNRGDSARVNQVFDAGFDDIARFPLSDSEQYQRLLHAAVAGYRPFLQQVAAGAPPQAVLSSFNDFRLLCALREGPFGVSGLNERVELSLHQQRLISRPAEGRGRWYVGRPVMIARNDSALGLYNGDIGIALPDAENALKVWFLLPDGTLKAVQPSRLPPHDTAWVMTVHKSQGSEFSHTVLVMPNKSLPVLTRELVYTAITRARQRLTLYSDPRVFERAVAQRTVRRSGLAERLNDEAPIGAPPEH
ncbi:exodeoxyribonuclease V subunit alpha [Pantoea sp. 1.19]|uniref:exodeoxyribonuclease V subunit alpha n=1 Tax=Pantoea sp. 1.19 TaxID=1925589 RepID=UPI000948BE94|nr:exodeoxyribonuclease V subunit alpha [Pantoea sp. 1.19]